MEPFPDWILQFGGMAVGGVATYFAAMNAIRETLARHDERIKSAEENATEAKSRAQFAHERIDRMLTK